MQIEVGTLWLMLIGMGVGTYALRLSFILLLGQMDVPSVLVRALRFVPAAVLCALIFPALSLKSGTLDVSLTNERLLAGMLAALVAWRTNNVLLTIGIGMTGLWILQAIM